MNGNQMIKTEILGVGAFAAELPLAQNSNNLSMNVTPVVTSITQLGYTSMAEVPNANNEAMPLPAGQSQPKPKPAWKRNYLGKRPRLSFDNNIRREKQVKHVIPKNSLQLIKEYYNGEQAKDKDYPRDPQTEMFKHELLVNDQTFVGEGRNKKLAKQSAYDQAFERLFIEPNKEMIRSMVAKCGNPGPSQTPVAPNETKNGTNPDDNKMQTDSEPAAPQLHMNGKYPFILSFAMHEYFTNYFAKEENNSQVAPGNGTTSNITKTPSGSLSSLTKPILTAVRHQLNPARKLPNNAHEMNPTALIHIMRPEAKFIEMERDESGNFVMKLELDGKTFISAATNKKNSKLQCSQLACESLFNICYPLALH